MKQIFQHLSINCTNHILFDLILNLVLEEARVGVWHLCGGEVICQGLSLRLIVFEIYEKVVDN